MLQDRLFGQGHSCDMGRDVSSGTALERTYHRHAGILSLVNIPRSPEEGFDRQKRTVIVPSDRQLSPLPLEPQHEFLCGTRGRVSLCVAENEVEADVA